LIDFREIEKSLTVNFGTQFQIINSTPLQGGDINQVFKLETSEESYCIKINKADSFPNLFKTEFDGLNTLISADEIDIVEPICHGEINGHTYLLLAFVEIGQATDKTQLNFGRQLAQLHLHSDINFGLTYDNYIGSLVQKNKPTKNWSDFFFDQRLLPQIRIAQKSNLLQAEDLKHFENFKNRLSELFPEEPPALLHGDLWNGNYLVNKKGNAVLIDPAIYYGNREMDLAMTKLFGGFERMFYEGYHENYPLSPGWEDRVQYWNLYPLLVHLNLFGGSYLPSLRQIINKF